MVGDQLKAENEWHEFGTWLSGIAAEYTVSLGIWLRDPHFFP